MATRKCGNIYFRKYFMTVRKFTNIFVLLLVLMVGSRDTLFLVCFTLKNVRTGRQQAVAAPKCQPSEDEPPIIKGAVCGTYGSSTTARKSRSPSRPEWLRRRQSRPSCMDAVVRGPFARNTTPNSAPYTTESCFVS